MKRLRACDHLVSVAFKEDRVSVERGRKAWAWWKLKDVAEGKQWRQTKAERKAMGGGTEVSTGFKKRLRKQGRVRRRPHQ